MENILIMTPMGVKLTGFINMPQIGRVVLFHRKKTGLTRNELATMAGVGKKALYDVEKGKPSVQCDTLGKILTTLNISLRLDSQLMKLFWETQHENG